MQEAYQLKILADGEVGEEGLYHLFVGLEISLVYLHHQYA
jgi:hypothetical protein